MTFDLVPELERHVKRNLPFVPFQLLKFENFCIFAANMDMDRCNEVTSMVYTDIVSFPRSSEFDRGK